MYNIYLYIYSPSVPSDRCWVDCWWSSLSLFAEGEGGGGRLFGPGGGGGGGGIIGPGGGGGGRPFGTGGGSGGGTPKM